MEPENKPLGAAGVKQMPVRLSPLPITSIEFNGDGSLMAYAHSYDWSKGHQGNDPAAADPKMKPNIMVRCVQDTDIKTPQK
jgi:hypothetical protein